MHHEILRSTDVARFEALCRIYEQSIPAVEQKAPEQLRAMHRRGDYRFIIARQDETVLGFSILYVPAGADFCLLEYMAVAPDVRKRAIGAGLFKASLALAAPLPEQRSMILEVDSDSWAGNDQHVRTSRQRFYRRLGCARIAGLKYHLPLPSAAQWPAMELLIYSALPPSTIARGRLSAWLKQVYVSVYACEPDDPRLAFMLKDLPDPVPLV